MQLVNLSLHELRDERISLGKKQVSIKINNACAFDLDRLCNDLKKLSWNSDWTREETAACIVSWFLNNWREVETEEKIERVLSSYLVCPACAIDEEEC